MFERADPKTERNQIILVVLLLIVVVITVAAAIIVSSNPALQQSISSIASGGQQNQTNQQGSSNPSVSIPKEIITVDNNNTVSVNNEKVVFTNGWNISKSPLDQESEEFLALPFSCQELCKVYTVSKGSVSFYIIDNQILTNYERDFGTEAIKAMDFSTSLGNKTLNYIETELYTIPESVEYDPETGNEILATTSYYPGQVYGCLDINLCVSSGQIAGDSSEETVNFFTNFITGIRFQ